MSKKKHDEQVMPHPSMARIVQRNIAALIARRQQEENERRIQDKIADAVTRFTGSLSFVYIHIVGFGLWIVINLGWTPFEKFDPTFVILAMFASVEAIFLSTFVLITQNRMQAQADRRADLDLQISLLAEYEITQLLQITSTIADHLGLHINDHGELTELQQDIKPEHVLDKIAETEREFKERNEKSS